MSARKPRISWRARPRVIVSLGDRVALRAIVELAREWGWDLVDVVFTRGVIPDNPAPQGALVDLLPTDPLVKRLIQMGCPTVRLGGLPHHQDHSVPAVLPDLTLWGRVALDHFAERGFRDVAFIAHNPTRREENFNSLYVAFSQRARERGLHFHLHELIHGDQASPETFHDPSAKYQRRVQEVGGWLASLPMPVGVLASNDYMAATVCTMCMECGLSMPDKVALLGIGNDPLICELSPVALSSLDPAEDERGRQAALLLRGMMRGDAAPAQPVMVPPRGVVERRSTNMLAVPDALVVQGIRFIWDHFDQNLSVDDVASAVGVTRRKLERAFRMHLKRGVNAELRRKRLERLREMLRTSALPVSKIVSMVGYQSRYYLNASFRRAYGCSPAEYRRQHRS